MSSSSSLYLFLILVAVAQAQFTPVNSTATLDIILEQEAQAADNMVFDADAFWGNATLFMSNLNIALELAAANLTALYNPADATTLASLLNATECNVDTFANFISNATLTYSFLCCHIQKVRIPGMISVMNQASVIFHGSPLDVDADNIPASLQGLQTMQILDENGFIISQCLDDKVLFNAQQAVVRALNAMEVMSNILEVYSAIYQNSLSFQTCFNNVSSGCMQSTPLSLAQISPNLQFASYDPSFTSICGSAALGAFDRMQITSPCGPVAPFS